MGQCESHTLTDKDKALIRDSFAVMKKDMKGYGIRFFMEFFEQYPSYQELFPAFAYVPLSEVKDNAKFKAHAITVMYALSSVISALDDPEVQEAMITKIARQHITRKVVQDDYRKLAEVIGKVVATVFNEETTAAWFKGYECLDEIARKAVA